VDCLNPTVPAAHALLEEIIIHRRTEVTRLHPLWKKLAREVPVLQRCYEWARSYLLTAIHIAGSASASAADNNDELQFSEWTRPGSTSASASNDDGNSDGWGSMAWAHDGADADTILADYNSDAEFKKLFTSHVDTQLRNIVRRPYPHQIAIIHRLQYTLCQDVLDAPLHQLPLIKRHLLLNMQMIDRSRFILSKTSACPTTVPRPMPFLHGDQLILNRYYRIAFGNRCYGVFRYLGGNMFQRDCERDPHFYYVTVFAPDSRHYRICEVPMVV
jgi:hypothetical protein